MWGWSRAHGFGCLAGPADRVHHFNLGICFEGCLNSFFGRSSNLLGMQMLELVRDSFGEEAHQVGVDHNAIHISAFAAAGPIMVPHRRQRVAGLETVHCYDLTSDHCEEELWEQGFRLLAGLRLEARGVNPSIEVLELTERMTMGWRCASWRGPEKSSQAGNQPRRPGSPKS